MSTNRTQTTKSRLMDACVVAVIRAADSETAIRMAHTLIEGGIGTLEITMTVPNATEAIRKLSTQSDAMIGAGTVLTREDVAQCADAGAQFIVSPACIAEVIEAARNRGLVVMPGALTPTEVVTAWRLGADFVKIFPAARMGPRYLGDLKGPLPDVHLVPTGGITAANAPEYLAAGASLLGLGSWLADPKALAIGQDDQILERARQLVAAIGEFRQEKA